MNSAVLKVAVGAVSVGGVVGGGILINKYSSIPAAEDNRLTIGELIERSKTKIAVKEETKWNDLWTKYKNDNQNKGAGKDIWNLAEWKGSNNPATIPNSYKNKCISLSMERMILSIVSFWRGVLGIRVWETF